MGDTRIGTVAAPHRFQRAGGGVALRVGRELARPNAPMPAHGSQCQGDGVDRNRVLQVDEAGDYLQ